LKNMGMRRSYGLNLVPFNANIIFMKTGLSGIACPPDYALQPYLTRETA